MSGWHVILIVCVLVGGAIAAYLGHRAEQRRRAEMAALAASLGWRFDHRRDRAHDDQYAHFGIFRRGHSRAAYNTLEGELVVDERPCPSRMGDFVYRVTRHSGKSSSTRTYRFSYLIVHLPFRGAPDLLIRPEGVLDRLAGAFGFDDIDFESAEFSRRFYVRSSDKRMAYDILHPEMMEYLLGTAAEAVDIERDRCCMSDGRRRWTPGEFRGKLHWIRRFLELWPEHVTSGLEKR
jgi:hypothetical protein